MQKRVLRLRLFQSHAGSIEAALVDFDYDDVVRFQSHAGSIEAPEPASRRGRRLKVSIPRWFD